MKRQTTQLLFALAVLALLVVVLAPSSRAAQGARIARVAAAAPSSLSAWSVVANYPAIIESPTVGSDGTFAYVAAGNVGGSASNMANRYDPVANTWTPIAPIPVAVYATRGVYAANTNSYYVFGGYNGAVQSTTQIYNVGTNTWSSGAPMPDGRYFPNLAYYPSTGKIYLIGGFDTTFTEANETWEYDPIANTWNTSRLNIPVATAGAATSISGQFIYLVGTWNGGTGSTTHNRYDITNNVWAPMAALPVPVYEAVGANIGGQNYVVGGGNPDRPATAPRAPKGIPGLDRPNTSYTSTFIYDIAGNSWTSGPNTNVAHSFTGGTAIGNRLLIVGGFNGASDTNTVETATVTTVTNTPTPTPGTPTPTPSCNPSGNYRVLIVHADDGAPPNTFRSNLQAEPGISLVDIFDGTTGTPSVAQLQGYDIVVPFSNFGWSDQTTLGNNLDAYLAGGGIVVAFNFDWFGGGQSIAGAWLTNNDTPFNNPGSTNFSNGSLGTCTFAPLCDGVTTLNSFFREILTPAPGATLAATWNDATPLIAFKGRAVGLSAYVGDNPNDFSGQFSRVVANAGRFFSPPPCLATPTPTNTPTNTPVPPTDTPTSTPTPTPTPACVSPCVIAPPPAPVVVTNCAAPPVTTSSSWTQINLPGSDVVLQCALAQLAGTSGVRIIAHSIMVDGPGGGMVNSSGTNGTQLLAGSTASQCNAGATVDVETASIVASNPNGGTKITGCGDIVINNSTVNGGTAGVTVTSSGGRVCATSDTMSGSAVFVTASGDLTMHGTTVTVATPSDTIKLTSMAGSVLAGGSGGCLPNRFTGGNDSNMSVTANGRIDLTSACVEIAQDITVTASGTGFVCATDAIIDLGSAEIRNDYGQKGTITMTACGGVGRIEIGNAILVDSGKKGGGWDPNKVSNLNGSLGTQPVNCAATTVPTCTARPLDAANNPVSANPADRAAHNVTGVPRCDT